jgi:elongation of very long chain fatty acids protein 6
MSFEASGYEPVMVDGFYRSRSGINHSNLFFYEKKFFNDDYVYTKRQWMKNNWHMSFVYAAIYIVLIFLGQMFMKNREKFDLRRALIAWNLVLALFSIAGSVRTLPEFINTLSKKGVEYSVCNNDYTHGVSGCWAWLFILSKVPELVDTFFIVVRKQPLIFLHW